MSKFQRSSLNHQTALIPWNGSPSSLAKIVEIQLGCPIITIGFDRSGESRCCTY